MAAHGGPNIETDGLVLHLDAANEQSYPGSGTTWTDLSGNGNDGTLTNSPTYSSDNKGRIRFDSSNEKITTSISSFGTDMTWEAWVNRSSSVNSYNMFMGRLLPYFGLRSAGNIIFSNSIGGSQKTLNSTGFTVTNDTWYYLVFTTEYNGTNTIPKIYINGVLNNSTTFSGSQNNSGSYGTFTVGEGRSSSSWYPFNGNVSNIKIYNRTLTADEVQQNFSAKRGRYGI